jgi:hypothetical protein
LRDHTGQQKHLAQLEQDVEETFALFENEFDQRLERIQTDLAELLAALRKEVLEVIEKWTDGVSGAIAEQKTAARKELLK